MTYLGAKPKGRNTEQHDWFFSIGDSINDIIPEIKIFWPEAAKTKKFHIDSYRQVTYEKGYIIYLEPRIEEDKNLAHEWRPFFINLGGYKKDVAGEFHYPDLYIAENKQSAIEMAKQTAFFQHTGYEGAPSHIDDKYGIGVDDLYDIEDMLPKEVRKNYRIRIIKATGKCLKDEIYSGFQLLSKFEK